MAEETFEQAIERYGRKRLEIAKHRIQEFGDVRRNEEELMDWKLFCADVEKAEQLSDAGDFRWVEFNTNFWLLYAHEFPKQYAKFYGHPPMKFKDEEEENEKTAEIARNLGSKINSSDVPTSKVPRT